MEFNDKNLRLIINNLQFKAYLEDSDVSYETKDQQLPFTPTSFTNDSMAIRVSEKAKFTFNVFSETRDECIQNYRNLQYLLKIIKPSYRYVNDQIVPESSNVTGFVTLQFNGMPKIDKDKVDLHLTSFSYTINKDLGYIHIPVKDLIKGESTTYADKDMKLIPIAYKISLEGKILLQFEETANFLNSKTVDNSNVEAQNSMEKQSNIKKLQESFSALERLLIITGVLSQDRTTLNTNNDSGKEILLNKYLETGKQLKDSLESIGQ